MVGNIIHDQDDGLRRIRAQEQSFEKLNEGLAVLVSGREIRHVVGAPVIGADDIVKVLRPISCWQPFLLAAFHPTGSNGKLETHGRFVHKAELEITVKGAFFNSSSNAAT